MSLKFPTSKYAKFPSATFLDNQGQLSVFVRIRFDSIVAGDQFIFRHRLGTSGDQFSIRKDSATGKIKATITAGGAAFLTRESTQVPTAGQIFDVAVVYQEGQANGFNMWVNGTQLSGNVSTVSMSANYDTAGGDLMIAAQNPGAPGSFGVCSIEKFAWWPGHVLTQAQIDGLRTGCWPSQVPGLPTPAFHYAMNGGAIDALIDDSINHRSISGASVVGPLQDGGLLGLWDHRSYSAFGVLTQLVASAPPPPPPVESWTLITPPGSEVPHPLAAFQDSGLTDGLTYEYKIVPFDASGNVGPDSAAVAVTPQVPAPSISSFNVAWQPGRRWSRFKVTQQE